MYFQAQKELESGWEMMKMETGSVTWFKWIEENVKDGQIVGFNPFLFAAGKRI